MKLFLKKNTKVVVAFILGVVVTSGIVYAAILNGVDITYDNTNSNLSATTVQGAIDELSTQAQNSSSGFKDRKGCEYKCSNGFYAEYYNGTMIGCRYASSSAYGICDGSGGGGTSLWICQISSTYFYQKQPLNEYCNEKLPSYIYINGGGCPETYTCP